MSKCWEGATNDSRIQQKNKAEKVRNAVPLTGQLGYVKNHNNYSIQTGLCSCLWSEGNLKPAKGKKTLHERQFWLFHQDQDIYVHLCCLSKWCYIGDLNVSFPQIHWSPALTQLLYAEVRLLPLRLWVKQDTTDTPRTQWEGISQGSRTLWLLPYHSKEVKRLPEFDSLESDKNKDLDDIWLCQSQFSEVIWVK